ncbi:MAG: GNAT family N-acetyltransferase [Eubacteriales bacterium]|nr:GNAT family N-acetyltransferase [Eubacteriales bacterium]
MAAIRMRSAKLEDMPAVYAIFRDAIERMNQSGIPQWDEIYPTPAILDADLASGKLYVAESDAGMVAAAVALNEECHPDYQTAAWQGEEPYLIVHRLCVSPAAQCMGVGRAMMLAVEDWARANGYADIRLDAFSQNPYALRMYTRLGYEKRGEAVWRKGLFFLMEKSLR